MIANDTLVQIIRGLIGRRSEGVYWDFKLEHHSNTGNLIHDVLCLANAEHDGLRFLVFGVEDGGASVQSIEDDSGRRTQADIATLFRDNAGKFFQSRFPTFHLRTIEVEGKQVDVLIIEDEPKKPYYLVERIKNLRAHHIYTRVCDTNTPIDRAAQPHEIERMWRQRFGLDAPALEKAERCLAEPTAWTLSEEDGYACCHHDVFPEFTLRAASAGDRLDSSQEWTRGEVRTDNNHAGWYELRCHQTLLRRIHYVSFDDNKKSIVAPDWRPIGRGRFYFYHADSVQYAVQRFWAALEGRDDSEGLLVRGGGEPANEARSRWGGRLDIPVLKPGELEGFLQGRQTNAIRARGPATDRGEQYELFLRILIDFADWRRVQLGEQQSDGTRIDPTTTGKLEALGSRGVEP